MSEQQGRMQLSTDELRTSLQLHARACQTAAGNAFFNSFEYVTDLHNGNYSGCLIKGLKLLASCKAIDPISYSSIHKGSAFYWIGMAAYLSNDYQTATFFFDAAVSEDLRSGHHPITRSTPSFKFILAQGDLQEQAAKPLVEALQARLQRSA